LAIGTKPILRKLIRSDQKGFFGGSNISESNQIIDDIINYVDEEDQEGIIVFVDQEKAYDRVEWGWVNHVLKGFNFGSKFCGWIQMLFKNAKTCIKPNGFISNCSGYRGQPGRDVRLHRYFAFFKQNQLPVLLDVQTKLRECPGVKMFLNRTYVCLPMTHNFLIEMKNQLNSLLKSGSKINYEKAKGLFIGRLRGKRPRFTKMSWATDNIKAL